MDERNHHTALYLLEVVLNHRGPVPIAALYFSVYASFYSNLGFINPFALTVPVTSTSFSDFVAFLRSFPSLFFITGDYVYAAETFDYDYKLKELNEKVPYIDFISPCLGAKSTTHKSYAPLIMNLDPLIRQNVVMFIQNYLLNCTNHCFTIEKLLNCLYCVFPYLRIAFRDINTFCSFLRQYTDLFNVKDLTVSLLKPKRSLRPVFQTDKVECQNRSITEKSGSMPTQIQVETFLSSSSDFSDCKSCIVPASDLSVILILRRILRNMDKNELHVAILIQKLTDSNIDVQNVIGLTRFELHAFLDKYKTFFEIIPIYKTSTNEKDEETNTLLHRIPNNFSVKIQPMALHMKIHIVDRKNTNKNGKDPFKLEKHIGCVYRVAKSWGIIDLGNHVHVFFDKSIFRNVIDLQKVFHATELVYFDAVRAPLRSRAKWRATRVWKPDDHDVLQHVKSCQTNDAENNNTECLPFLLPSCSQQKNKSTLHKRSTKSMPTMQNSLKNKYNCFNRRCRSLERVGLSNRSSDTSNTEEEKSNYDKFSNLDDAYYLSEEDEFNISDLKLSLCPNGVDSFFLNSELASYASSPVKALPTDDNNFLSINHNELFLYDGLKRPIKLLYNTGGYLADVEFPESEISWTPDIDNMSAVSSFASRPITEFDQEFSSSSKHQLLTTCNACTQTWSPESLNCIEMCQVVSGADVQFKE